jgi:selenophosphate synthase
MKSLHHLIPICAVALCTLLMASAAAAFESAHTAMSHAVSVTRIAPGATVRQVGAIGTASSKTAPHMGTLHEDDPQMAGQFCIAHWQDSTCRGVLALHDEALKLQQKDGGKLSPEHREQLQSKLDAVLADVQSKLDAERQPSG